MSNVKNNKFIFNWILTNKLAVGTSPIDSDNIIFLKKKKVRNIIGLCSFEESQWNENLYENFCCQRIVLPDSRKDELPNKKDLLNAFYKLRDAIDDDITFIHCFASIERSPLVCIMYIIYKYNLKIEDALDYVRRTHKYTNPTNSQLSLVKEVMIQIAK